MQKNNLKKPSRSQMKSSDKDTALCWLVDQLEGLNSISNKKIILTKKEKKPVIWYCTLSVTYKLIFKKSGVGWGACKNSMSSRPAARYNCNNFPIFCVHLSESAKRELLRLLRGMGMRVCPIADKFNWIASDQQLRHNYDCHNFTGIFRQFLEFLSRMFPIKGHSRLSLSLNLLCPC